MAGSIDLLEAARANGLRTYGVSDSEAYKMLAGFMREVERRRGPLSERLEWKDAAQLPDVDVTFQLYDPEANEPVWPGYHDGKCWVYADGMPAKPTHYAAMPRGPGAPSPFHVHRARVLERTNYGSILRNLVLHLDAGGTGPNWNESLIVGYEVERIAAAMLAAAQPGMPVDPELARLADDVRALRERWEEEGRRAEEEGRRPRRRYG